MSEPTKEQITKDFAEVCRRYRLPGRENQQNPGGRFRHPGVLRTSPCLWRRSFLTCIRVAPLRGLRLHEGLTPGAACPRLLGVKRSNLSEMENGKRPIGKNMAKRLAQVLKTNYKVFL